MNPIFYLCTDPERALGLEKVLPNFHIICIDYSPIVDYIQKSGTPIFCLEKELTQVNAIFRNSNRLLNHPKVLDYIKKNTPAGSIPNIMFFKIALNSEITVRKLGFRLLNTPAKLNEMFELKLSQFQLLCNKCPYFPQTRLQVVKYMDFDALSEEFGLPFVIQYDRGHTGSSTVFIKNCEDLENEKKKFPLRQCKVSRQINGDAWTINTCVTRFGIMYGGLSYQITGIKECTSNPGATVGNDWTKSTSLKVREKIGLISRDIGEVMRQNGFRGMFGLDLIVTPDEEVYMIEVNARQTASVSMHTKLMYRNDQIPMQLFHIAEFAFPEASENKQYLDFINSYSNSDTQLTEKNVNEILMSQNARAIMPLQASQIIIRNTKSEPLTVINQFVPGAYNSNGEFMQEAYCTDDLQNDSELLVIAAGQGRTITPENEVSRIQTIGSVTQESGQPKDTILSTIKRIKETVGL